MVIHAGTKLGPFEIVAPLGAGGMGEVYRARDMRLGRDVAIKILPRHLSASVEFQTRFEREAKSISLLSHPHICTLYDVGHEDGMSYLVMELLEGQTLSGRIEKGPMPLDNVLRYGAEIASALDAAHRKRVVHRDLKPGNIVLTKAGAKLLDFGLAKSSGVMESDPGAVTASQPLTSKGTILGTFQYMAPEQLEGAEADTRTDIFALGAVLYEMLTGKRAFEGASRASLIASIMAAQPRPISELQPMTPPALDRLIRKCLAKDPDSRWQSAADVADELRWITEGGSRTGVSGPLRSARNAPVGIWIACFIILLLGCAGLVFQILKNNGKKANRVWSSIAAPEQATLVASGDAAGPVVISPDGKALAFVATGIEGSRVWVRPLDGPTARPLQGTEGATFPFWSSDSHSIGYFAREKLFSVSAGGGPPMPICDARAGRGGTWGRDGTILFAPEFRSAIVRVPASGGKPEPVTKLDESLHTSHRWPAFCPDGKHFLYVAVTHGATESEGNAVYLGSLDGSESKLVMHGGANAALAGDRLLFLRESTLLAAPFDIGAAKLIGDPTVVATGVMYDVAIWRAAFSVSNVGILAFHTGTAGHELQMKRVDRSGKVLGNIGDPWQFGNLSLSPDGSRVATDVGSTETDVWVYEVARGVKSRITFGNAANLAPHWSPDGQTLVYASMYLARRDATHRISRRPAMGGDEEVLYTSPEETWVSDWSSDGKYLLLIRGNYIGGNPCDIWALPLLGDRKPFPLLTSAFRENEARFSPDGKWVAYESDESGRMEIYVIPFHPPAEDGSATPEPTVGGKWQVSSNGGTYPCWRRDGKEIFFTSIYGKLTAVEIELSLEGVTIGTPKELFTIDQVAGIHPYDAAADGQWFVVNSSTVRQSSTIDLITNWDAELTKQ